MSETPMTTAAALASYARDLREAFSEEIVEALVIDAARYLVAQDGLAVRSDEA